MKYRELHRWKYELVENFEYQTDIKLSKPYVSRYLWLTKNGLLLIRKGYRWDGPSGPTLDTPSVMTPSLIHDALFQLIRLGILNEEEHKPIADSILEKEILVRATKTDKWYKYPLYWFDKIRAGYYYYGVKYFSGYACKPREDGEEPEIIEVE